MDWSDPEARRAFLAAIVADAERLPGQALTSPQATDREHPDRPRIMEAAGLLCKLLVPAYCYRIRRGKSNLDTSRS